MHQLSCMRAVAALVILMIPGHPGPRQAEEPEARARELPAGVTEMELIRSVIPEYDQEVARWRNSKDGSDLFRASVWEALETDLGFAGRRHVLFAVGGQGGICAQCSFFRVGVFDIERRRLLFRHDHSGIGPEPAVRTFHLAGDGQRLCISFREGGGSLNMGGFSETTEEWYRPRLRADGTLEFDHVGSGLIARSYTDDVSWNHESICGRIQPLSASSRHEYRQTARFGVLKPDGNPAAAFSDEEWELPECVCDRCGVEIRRLERWDYDRRARRLVRRSERLSRIDLFPVPAFPFDLPVRKPSYRRLAARVPVEFGGSRGTRVTSPTGDGVIVWDPVAWKVDKVELRIVSAVGDDLLRTVYSIRCLRLGYRFAGMGEERTAHLPCCPNREDQSGASVLQHGWTRGLLGRSRHVGFAALAARFRVGSRRDGRRRSAMGRSAKAVLPGSAWGEVATTWSWRRSRDADRHEERSLPNILRES